MFQILETKAHILADNALAAEKTRDYMKTHGIVLVNLMGSPGAGKTSVLQRLIALLGNRYKIGVMEADVESDVDAKTIAATGAKVIQLHTAGLCHMDADMTRRGIEALGVDGLDLVFLENIGNLVCPAEFEIGADLRMMLLSVPEGDDKPLKYPLMFATSDVLLFNKTDTLPVFDFDAEKAAARARRLNPEIKIYAVSAKEGTGFAPVAKLLENMIEQRRTQE